MGIPRHRLVTIGDSVTQGFQSGAIFKTEQSYPAIIAVELGWREFRFPIYDRPEDGIHPTTISYGIIAQEVIKIMQLAGVKFYQNDGKTERTGEIKVDFQRLIAADTLISRTPPNVGNILELVGGFDKNFNVLSGMLKRNY
ncbi:MAG: hypothetical protein ACHBN1_15170 [Heteroscytonema crispum UTEX LB 1556]